MRKKTIVILSHASSNGKVPYTSYVHSHAVALTKKGYNVIVLASIVLKPNIKYRKSEYIDGVRVIYFKRFGFSNLLYKSKINLNAIAYYFGVNKIFKKIIKENNVVLIDSHTFKVPGVAASYLKRKYGIKTFVTLHGTSFDRNLHFNNGIKSIKKVAKSVDYFVCVSEKIRNQLRELNIHNTKVIYNGITFNENKINKKNKHSIITVGSFTYDKNLDVVIKSFARILKKYSDAHLTIIGDGEDKDKLLELALPYKDNITFTGFLPNNEVLSRLSVADVFVLPSSPEGFGICYVEAMHNKCITIGTKGEGIDGFIKNSENGFLVSIDELEIFNLVDQIFSNKYDLNKIREMAYKSASSLTWDKNADSYIKLLGEKK